MQHFKVSIRTERTIKMQAANQLAVAYVNQRTLAQGWWGRRREGWCWEFILSLAMFRQSVTRFVSYTNKRAWENCPFTQSRVSVRGLQTTSAVRAAFNVQDEEDFTDRVLKSTTPVVVDFHAQ